LTWAYSGKALRTPHLPAPAACHLPQCARSWPPISQKKMLRWQMRPANTKRIRYYGLGSGTSFDDPAKGLVRPLICSNTGNQRELKQSTSFIFMAKTNFRFRRNEESKIARRPATPNLGCALPLVGCALPLVGCALPLVGCALPLVGCALPLVGCALPLVGCALPLVGIPLVGCRPL
jgi:hypothetical protein